MSDDDNQILVPQSFIDPHRSASGRLLVPVAHLRERYELCEDLACHLVEQAQTLYHSGNSSEEGVLLGFHSALAAEGLVVTTVEAGWVIQRLAELLEWKAPELAPPES